jgi:CubicO group peptidase (beta-lactamase class C family)
MTDRPRDYWPTDEWRTASPEQRGMDGETLNRIHEFGLATDPPANGFVVVRDGYVVYEEYFRGFGERSYNNVNSVTKSIVSALIGIALRDGLLTSLDQPLADFFPEVPLDDARKRRITIKHMLTMTSGFSPESRDVQAQLVTDDPAGFAWRRPLAHDPGERFFYDDHATQLLSLLIGRLTGMTAAEYACRELFEPLGIWTDPGIKNLWSKEPFGPHTFHFWGRWPENGLLWKTDKQGNSLAGFGSHFTLREMAKLGWLYLNRGAWDGRQIVPEAYVAESTRPHSRGSTPDAPSPSPYGYLWWLVDDDPTVFVASGFGGQQIWVMPSADVVVALASSPRLGAPAVVRRIVMPAMRT